MAIQAEDHVAIGESLLPEFMRKPRILGVLRALWLTQLNDIEAAYLQLANERTIADAEGDLLNTIGKIVGAIRVDDINDETYRRIIRAQVLVNRSEGTPPQLFEIARVFFGDPDASGYVLTDEYPAAFRMDVVSITLDPDALILARLLRKAKPAGVGFQLVASAVPLADTFQVSDTFGAYETDNDRGFGWTTLPGVGGELAWTFDGST